MTFDKNGNLSPYGLIDTDLVEVRRWFVNGFPESISRAAIFEAFYDYISELRNALTASFEVWLDGSFITEKLNPNDVDFVVFIDTDIVSEHIVTIRRFRERRYGRHSLTDGYFEEVYPHNHPNYRVGLLNRADRERLFGYDAEGNRKGICQLVIS